jgi:hypothetical protein
MHRIRQEDLPFKGLSHNFIGAENGDVNSFRAIGDTPLVEVDAHLSPRFIQENLG